MEAQALTWPRAGNEAPPPPSRSIEEIEQEARERGYADGLAAGEAAGRERLEIELHNALEPVRALHTELQAHRLILEGEECDLLASLIVSAFETLLAIQLRLDGQALAGVLTEAIEHLPHQEGLEIHAHPEVVKSLSGHFADVQLIADEALAPAALDVRSASGRWRADAVQEFGRLVEEAFARVEHAPSDR